MNKQKYCNVFVLSLLLMLGVMYSAQIFVSYNHSTTQIVKTDISSDPTESGEESLKETSHHLFLHEKVRYHLKPIISIIAKINTNIEVSLPEAYLQLNTPPPDFA